MYFVRFVLFCTDAVNDFLNKNCPYVAAAIAFYSLFSFFPLVLAIISIYGFVLGPQAEGSKLAQDIAEVVPVSTEFVSTTVRGVVSARTITGIASVIALLWASSAAFAAMRKGINAAWGITRTRPFLRELRDVSGDVPVPALYEGDAIGCLDRSVARFPCVRGRQVGFRLVRENLPGL